MTKKGEFSVCQFFQDGFYEYVRRFVSAEEAMEAAQHYTASVGAKMGLVSRVIITDGGDCTNFEWKFGQGVTFPQKQPPKEPRNKMPSCMWRVELEVRKQGSIGVFLWCPFTVRAKDSETATQYALDDAHDEGFETRGGRPPISLNATKGV